MRPSNGGPVCSSSAKITVPRNPNIGPVHTTPTKSKSPRHQLDTRIISSFNQVHCGTDIGPNTTIPPVQKQRGSSNSYVTRKSPPSPSKREHTFFKMDIIQVSPKSHQMKKPRERYDPCCCPPSPIANIRGGSGAVVRSNRKRAHSEKGPWSSSRSNSKGGMRTLAGDLNATPQAHNRRRAHSTGPLVGTTVLVSGGRSFSKDSLDSEDGSTDGSSISSLEESFKAMPASGQMSMPMQPKLRPMTAWPADYPQAYPYKHHKSPTKSGKPLTLADMAIPELPPALPSSHRKRNSLKGHDRNCDLESPVPSSTSRTHPHPQLTTTDLSYIETLTRNFTTIFSRRRLVNLVFFVSLGIVAISTLNDPSQTAHPHTIGSSSKQNLGGIDTETNSLMDTSFRTVKNFSGEWGLTFTDAAEEAQRNGNVRTRKKRQPRLAEANSLDTQRMTYNHLDGTSIKMPRSSSNHFVLTDDEIKKKTKSRGEDNFGKHQKSSSFKNRPSAMVAFAWISLLAIGLSSVWGEMIRLLRMMKLLMNRMSTSRYNHSHSR